MNIVDFFSNFSSICSYNYPVICFAGKEYQSLFFEKLRIYIEQQTGHELKKIKTDKDLSEIQVQLSTTFLGQTYWFWLTPFENVSSKKKKESYLKFLNAYQGPHRVITFISEDDKIKLSKDILCYDLQDMYQYEQVKKIPILYNKSKPEVEAYFYSKLYRYKKEFSLDQLCMLKEYAGLLGKNIHQFFDTWIEKLIVSDVSLFYISQLFFEKDAEQFFQKWQEMRSYYSDQFWTSFFSEQLFKAYFYVQHQGYIPADQKQLKFGLPFSFLNHDWKLYQKQELQVAHQKIYEIDLSLKSGGSVYQLDSFFASFFNGSFS